MEKIIVLLSGGLDSRLCLKIMQEKYEVVAVHFKLPFGTGCCNHNCSFNFSQLSGVKLEIFDCTKGKLLQEYLNVVRHPKYGYGTSMNPCIDCRIFMFKKAKEYADKNNIQFIATGEVLDERPMSQTKKAMNIIDNESGLNGRILRPLCEMGFHGRTRKKQIELAEKYQISYPNPGGGCLLCEKSLKKRLKFLLHRDLNEKEVSIIGIGRHFFIDNCGKTLGRNEEENNILETFENVFIPEDLGPSALIIGERGRLIDNKIYELIRAYSKKGAERGKFEIYRL